jgi:acyl-CoA synthetase (NDP forming)
LGLLTKDQKIRYRAEELPSLAKHGKMFCLSSGNLTIEQQARMFEEARVPIERAVQRHEARFYQVYEFGRIVKRWP